MSEIGRRAPRGATYDPCPGCGEPKLRPKLRVCDVCDATLKAARRARAERAEAGEDTPVPHVMQERAYALPWLRGPRETSDRVRDAFFRLGQLLSEATDERVPMMPPDAEHNYHWTDFDRWAVWPFSRTEGRSGGDWQVTRLMRPSIAGALREAYAAAIDNANAVEKQGHAEGRALLLSLAAGTLTADEFNDRAARMDQRTK